MGTKDYDLLMKLYDESQIQRRHHETHRATLTGIIVTLYVALVSVYKEKQLCDWAFWSLLSVLSILGVVCTLSYTERYNYYWRRSQVIREMLAKKCENVNIEDILKEAKNYRPKDKKEDKWPRSIWPFLRHHKLWLLLHSLVFIVSLCFVYITICG